MVLARPVPVTGFVELAAASSYSFLAAAAQPDEMVLKAAALGQTALGIADENSLAGLVRAHIVAKTAGIRLVVGCRLVAEDGLTLLVWPQDRAAYARLSGLLSRGKRRAPKGECRFTRAELAEAAEGLWAALPVMDEADKKISLIKELYDIFNDRLSIAATLPRHGDDRRRLWLLARLAERSGVPLLATNQPLMSGPDRRPLLDVVTCIRTRTTLDQAGFQLTANAERYLKSAEDMAALFAGHQEALARSVAVAAACRFSLDELDCPYPAEADDPQAELERLTWEGAARRYPDGVPKTVRAQIAHEFALIADKGYAPYFLTVHDIVRYARSRAILCQGRGSAANSAVCYCLGITALDPLHHQMLFERFISAARDEPPDIDVDFEHERREEVIQYIYTKYGRDHAALTATVISYRSRSAIREVGKALGLAEDSTSALAGSNWGGSGTGPDDQRVRGLGFDPDQPRLRMALDLSRQIRGFPRHLSQHVGGFVLSRRPLSELVPIANAAMAGRTVIEWDKDDLDALGILKVDVLALGMLSCIARAFALLAAHWGRVMDLADVPADDPAVYAMLGRGDSLGVFQVESRAQMAMLPRLKPRCFFDLVIEVAIVRPGPIQGDMVHPYLRRRDGLEPVTYPSEALRKVLERTLGVPLFQEQAMKIAMVGAGFTAAEADSLRRAMASFRRAGAVAQFAEKFISGMIKNGYDSDFAKKCFHQIEGFGDYGFPESHAASFALLVYVSAWLKHHYPAAFACALLNSQPMGFYAPAQIVRDAREHGVAIRPVCINVSHWDNTIEKDGALRLGLRQIRGFAAADAEALVAARDDGYRDPRDLARRAGLPVAALERLARAGAFSSLGLARRAALWAIQRPDDGALPLFAGHAERAESAVNLPQLRPGEEVTEDYASLGLSLGCHPLALLRPALTGEGILTTERLARSANGAAVAVAGLVLVRQRPGSARGIVFLTLEDETGIANVVVRPPVFDRWRRDVLAAALLRIEGVVQREGPIVHLLARACRDRTALLGALRPGRGDEPPLRTISHDFH